MWDVFISHAWEDKVTIARPLAYALVQAGLNVWYDEFTLTPGDNLRQSIDRGLAESRYGIVILSPKFFAKKWPLLELEGLINRETFTTKVVIPVWHNVTWEDVQRFSPILASKIGISTAQGLDHVVREILRVAQPGIVVPSPPENITSPAVPRPVNLSFDAYAMDDWPSGWFNSLGHVDGVSIAYESRVVVRPDGGNGACVLFQNLQASANEFGSLMQRCPAHAWAGKAIRFEGEMKTHQVEDWAGLWLRADGDRALNLVFQNMSQQQIRGSIPWKKYVLDIQLPRETTWLNYGIVLSGRGTIWADNFKLMVWKNNMWVDV